MFFESSGKNAEMQKKPPVQETEAVFSLGRFEPDELTGYLEGIKNRCRYRRWFCGHYHMDEMVDERHTVMYRKVMRIE